MVLKYHDNLVQKNSAANRAVEGARRPYKTGFLADYWTSGGPGTSCQEASSCVHLAIFKEATMRIKPATSTCGGGEGGARMKGRWVRVG